ncbi:speckle-type POZ protein-like [Phymastichus coffea]|uniref:speckle-type POZ protein-like n=1 Tax=Phymastichus coffea TaxID=108790 RepID=UPI00273CB822|nr:speckle-type POZ protein-like [Phymastichus coffea]
MSSSNSSTSNNSINSFGKVEIVKCIPTFMWTINNFCACHKKTGDALKSPIFSMGNNNELNWCIDLYPKGFDKSYENFISLFLKLESCDQYVVKVKYKFCILNSKRSKTHEMGSETDRLFTPGCDWGFREFISRDTLFDKSNNLLPDNKLTIYCEIDVNRRTTNIFNENIMAPPKLSESQSKIIDDIEALMKSKKFCDVSLVVGDKKFYAHKTILAARSITFCTKFEENLEEKKVNVIEINNYDQKIVKEMLRYIYTGKVENLNKLAKDILPAANEYVLEGLKNMCENIISKNLNLDNVVEMLTIAASYNAQNLKKEAIDFIISNGEAITSTESFKSLAASQPLLIAEAFRTMVTTYSKPEQPVRKRKHSDENIDKEE